MEGLERAKEAVKGLKSAAGFIRRELGRRLSLRHTLKCCSALRDSIEYGANINRLLNGLESGRTAPAAGEEKPPGRAARDGWHTRGAGCV